MLFVIIGIALGLAVALGPLAFLYAPFDALSNFLVGATGDLVAGLLGKLAGVEHTEGVVVALSAVLGAATPGAVALGLVLTSRATKKVRQGVAALAVAIALGGFFFLPAADALILLVLACIFGILAGIFEGVVLTVPLLALATVLGVRYGVVLWTGEASEVAAGAAALAGLTSESGDMLVVWKLVLSFVGLTPFALAGWTAFFRR